MSEIENVAAEALQQEQSAQTSTSDAQQESLPAQPDSAAEQDDGKKAIRTVQKRINELTREKYEERARREQVEQEFHTLRQQVAAMETRSQAPQPEQFQDYNDYVRAEAKFNARQEAESIVQQRLNEMMPDPRVIQQQRMAQESQAQDQQAIARIVQDGAKKYQDFAQVVQNSEVSLSQNPAVMRAVLTSEKSADLSYYLAKNPQEAFRIVNSAPYDAVRLVGRLEATLTTKRVSTTPPPPGSVSGSSEGAVKKEWEMTTKEWMAHMDKKERAK